MFAFFQPLNGCNRRVLHLLGVAASLGLCLPTAAIAAYVPPTDQVPPRTRGTAAGRRTGCEGVRPTTESGYLSMVGLAPLNYMGKTASRQPAFAWYLRESNAVPSEFTLYEYDRGNLSPQPLLRRSVESKPGTNVVSLQGSNVTLTPGKTYVWQVVMTCSRTNPSGNPWLRHPVQAVAPSAELQAKLAKATDVVAQMGLYAKAGLWYDAIALGLHDNASSAAKREMFALIGELASLERQREPKEMPEATSVSTNLERILPNKSS